MYWWWIIYPVQLSTGQLRCFIVHYIMFTQNIECWDIKIFRNAGNFLAKPLPPNARTAYALYGQQLSIVYSYFIDHTYLKSSCSDPTDPIFYTNYILKRKNLIIWCLEFMCKLVLNDRHTLIEQSAWKFLVLNMLYDM